MIKGFIAWEGGKRIEETKKYTSSAEKKSLHLIMAQMHKMSILVQDCDDALWSLRSNLAREESSKLANILKLRQECDLQTILRLSGMKRSSRLSINDFKISNRCKIIWSLLKTIFAHCEPYDHNLTFSPLRPYSIVFELNIYLRFAPIFSLSSWHLTYETNASDWFACLSQV